MAVPLTPFTQGSVVFAGALALTQDNAKLFWDDTNFRLGIGTAAPIDPVDSSGAVVVRGQAVGTAASTGIFDFSGGTTARMFSRGANSTTNGAFQFLSTRSDASNTLVFLAFDSAGRGVMGGTTGTTSAQAHLAIKGAGTAGAPADATSGAALLVGDTGGGANNGGEIRFGFNFDSNQQYFAAIKGLATDGTSNTLGHLAWYTRNVSSDTSLTERLRLTSAGGLNLGGTSDPGAGNMSATLYQTATALIALGGGAAPTLGTIGGSGPATAAQNTWLKMLDSTGASIFVPVWK